MMASIRGPARCGGGCLLVLLVLTMAVSPANSRNCYIKGCIACKGSQGAVKDCTTVQAESPKSILDFTSSCRRTSCSWYCVTISNQRGSAFTCMKASEQVYSLFEDCDEMPGGATPSTVCACQGDVCNHAVAPPPPPNTPPTYASGDGDDATPAPNLLSVAKEHLPRPSA